MRESGFAAAAGLGSLVLLLTACGGSSGSSSTSNPTTTSTAQPGGQATSAALSNVPPPGSIVLHVQKSNLGFVLALANGQVVYMYDKDTKGGTPACTGSCTSIWLPVTGGNPVPSPADTGLGTFGTVAGANGAHHEGQRRHVARDQAVREQHRHRLRITAGGSSVARPAA